MLAFSEGRDLFHKGTLNEPQSQFFEPRPPEKLFYLSVDPDEVWDLSASPSYQSFLRELRVSLSKKVKGINDLSFYPESQMVNHLLGDPIAYGRKHAKEIATLVDLADLVIVPDKEAEAQFHHALRSGSIWEKYWACIVCAQFGGKAKGVAPALQALEAERNLMVSMRAVEALALVKRKNPMPNLVQLANQSSSAVEVLMVLNTMVFFRDHHGFELGIKSLNI